METNSSLELTTRRALHELPKVIIGNHSRFFNAVLQSLKFFMFFMGLRWKEKSDRDYGPFPLIIIMRSKTSLTYCWASQSAYLVALPGFLAAEIRSESRLALSWSENRPVIDTRRPCFNATIVPTERLYIEVSMLFLNLLQRKNHLGNLHFDSSGHRAQQFNAADSLRSQLIYTLCISTFV